MPKRLTAKVGEYEKDGQTKGRYVNLGVILSNEHGEYVLLDPSVNLAGALLQQNRMNHSAGRKMGDKLMVSIFDDDQSQGSQQSAPQGGAGRDLGDDIPFAPEWRV